MVPAYAAFSVLLTVLHSPQACLVSVSHPDYNFELCCTEVTMSQKHLLPLLKTANYGSVPFPISSQLQAESTKIRLKCQAGEEMLGSSLEKECEGRGEEKTAGNLASLERMGRNGVAVSRSQCACGSRVQGHVDWLLRHRLSRVPNVCLEGMLWNLSSDFIKIRCIFISKLLIVRT